MVAVVRKNVAKPIQKDIMKDRTETDKYWFYLFVIILFVWLGACTYLCCNKNKFEPYLGHNCLYDQNGTDKGDFITNSLFNIVRLEEHTRESGPIVLYLNIIFYVCLLLFAIFAMFLRVYHKYCGHCLIICTGIQIVSISYRGGMFFNHGASSVIPWKDEFLYWDIPDIVSFLICIILLIVVATRKGIQVTARHLTNAIRFYYYHMNTLIFGLVILIVMGCLIIYTFETIKGVGTKNICLALPMTVLLGSSYLLLLHYYFGVAVISLTTANNYWKQEERKISAKDIARAIVVVYKYHFGTICFNATGILPLIVATATLIQSIVQTVRTKSGFAKKYIMMTFFFFVGEYSTMITAINGKNFNDATARFLHLPIEARRVAKNLRECQMIWMIVGLIMISVNNLMLIIKWMYYEDDPYFTQVAIFSYASIIYLYMPVALVVDVIMDTILLCEVEKNEAPNNASKDVLVQLPTEVSIAK
ncbi:uncharacterized protein LOC131666335 [Phymastichus coffea]|uniref:uncharacterized protein LOC131666335 n=1 Tax=Phymastichus coffea TaxID=108790 RepID=UPI00273A9C79|nr:uncharacterized protein LOC131666335 [Phymastichus coffea]XP_058794912.1 uncharacterized protein LOC131666335 [Phymastichus coffea]